jgi:hypothetical protein
VTFLLLARGVLIGVGATNRQLLSLLTKFLNRSFEMLAIVRKFAFGPFVAEEFDLAVGEFGRESVLKTGFLRSKVLCLRNKSDRNTFDTFRMTEIRREEEEADTEVNRWLW